MKKSIMRRNSNENDLLIIDKLFEK